MRKFHFIGLTDEEKSRELKRWKNCMRKQRRKREQKEQSECGSAERNDIELCFDEEDPIHVCDWPEDPVYIEGRGGRAAKRKRYRERKKQRKRQMTQQSEHGIVVENNYGYRSDIEVKLPPSASHTLREIWPKTHVLSQGKNTDETTTILIEEIKKVNVGVNVLCCDDWNALEMLKSLLQKLIKNHRQAPFKYMAWHYASPGRRRYSKRKRNTSTSLMKDHIPPVKKHKESSESLEREETTTNVDPGDMGTASKIPLPPLFKSKFVDSVATNSNANAINSGGNEDCAILKFLNFANDSGSKLVGSKLMQNNLYKATDPYFVSKFLKSSIQHAIPKELFGSPHNLRIFLYRWLPVLLGVPGRKSIGLGRLMKGVKVTKVLWASQVGTVGGRGKRACLVAKIWLWLLIDYVAVILSCHFVLAKTSGDGVYGRCHTFFAKRIWQSLKYSTLYKHIENSSEGSDPLLENKNRGWAISRSDPNLLNDKALAGPGGPLTSHLQLRVKKNGMRPVLHVRYSSKDTSIKNACLALLKYLTRNNRGGDLVENPLKSISQAWEKMYLLKTKSHGINEEKTGCPSFYAVCVDIEDAFGCVIQDKMYAILLYNINKANLALDTVVCLNEHNCMKKLRNGKCSFFKKFSLSWMEGGSIKQSENHSSSARVKLVSSKEIKVQKLSKFLEQCIKNQTVRVGKISYRLSRGLAQGSCFSPHLWILYFNALEEKHLNPHLSIGIKFSSLIRGMDDFLFLTEVREKAEWFFKKISDGFPDFNVYINLSKLCANFPIDGMGKMIEMSQYIKFWGLVLNPTDLSVMANYKGPPGRDITNSMNLYVLRKPRRIMEATSFANLKLSCMTLSSQYNGPKIVLCNVFRAALMQIARFHATVKIVLQPVGVKSPARKVSTVNPSESGSGSSNVIRSADKSSQDLSDVNVPCGSTDQRNLANNKISRRDGFNGKVPNQLLLTKLLLQRASLLASTVQYIGGKHALQSMPCREHVLWLTYSAYRTVLGKQGGRYPRVLFKLKCFLEATRKKITNEDITLLKEIVHLCNTSS